ncbi:MAG: hypothetical protein K5987_06250 [Lachnospiraceae bacterium]|jgi:hypothetical protein|nr:hypothetical protein [Lachnospiraceae bacterium]MCR4937736.1 hypothetical protein [Lachnospiraceae bacterium]
MEGNISDIKNLMDTLVSSDEGSYSSSSNQVMKQSDIDYLVGLLQELERYRKIGTPEQCEEYKKKALG